MALTQKPVSKEVKGRLKLPSLEDVLGILSNGFVRGGGGFLKVGGPELLKTGSASREVRVGVTQVSHAPQSCVCLLEYIVNLNPLLQVNSLVHLWVYW